MAEIKQTELLSALMGEQGQDAMKMMQRMQRLQRLMGNPPSEEAHRELPNETEESPDIFSRSRKESMISAAIPFLNREYQRDLYIVVRLMEMRRVLNGAFLETRERQEESPRLRQKKLLQAIGKYLPAQERGQMQMLLKMMDMKDILGQEEWK